MALDGATGKAHGDLKGHTMRHIQIPGRSLSILFPFIYSLLLSTILICRSCDDVTLLIIEYLLDFH